MNLVESVKSVKRIEQIETLFQKHFTNPAYMHFWILNINMALRVTDMLRIKFDDIDYSNNRIELREGKTSKTRDIKLNNKAMSIINCRKKMYPGDIYLFQSKGRRTQNKPPMPMSRSSFNKAFKEVADILDMNFNTHSCRKTRGYMLRMSGVPIETITKLLNHSSTSVTLRYVGIDQDEIDQTYDLEL